MQDLGLTYIRITLGSGFRGGGLGLPWGDSLGFYSGYTRVLLGLEIGVTEE